MKTDDTCEEFLWFAKTHSASAFELLSGLSLCVFHSLPSPSPLLCIRGACACVSATRGACDRALIACQSELASVWHLPGTHRCLPSAHPPTHMCPRIELITRAANHALLTITLHLGRVGRSQASGPQDGQSGAANKAGSHYCVCVCVRVPDGSCCCQVSHRD